MREKIAIVLVEDQMITRLGLRAVIGRFSDMEVIGEAGDGKEAVEIAARLKPAIVLMDVGMPVMDGIEATRRIKELQLGIRVLVMSSHDHDDDVFAALAAGADGYCLKDATAENLESAIRSVEQSASWLDPAIARRILKAVGSQQAAKQVPIKRMDKFALSTRELEILQLLVDGLSNQEMSARLFISIETVKSHMRHIMEKLAVADRTQAAIKALREGLL